MTDLRTLADAFAELERRADVTTNVTDASKSRAESNTPPIRRRRTWASHGWLAPTAAAAAVVLGVVAATVALAPGGDPGTQPGSQTNTSATSASTGQPAPTSEPSPASTPTVPRDSAELATRFQAVLGDTATFTVTETGSGTARIVPGPGTTSRSGEMGAFIGGVLTASGVSGGYNLWFHPGRAMGECGNCTRTQLADGSELWVERMSLQGPPGGLTIAVDLYRADGVVIKLFVSNARSPKGEADLLAPQPPLTEEQIIAVLTSPRW